MMQAMVDCPDIHFPLACCQGIRYSDNSGSFRP